MAQNRFDRRISQRSYPVCRGLRQLPLRRPKRARSGDGSSVTPTWRDAESPEVVDVLDRVARMSDQQIRERYHLLVDIGRGNLSALDRFELERIEARLDAEDRDPALEARDKEWQDERVALIKSVERLLGKLKGIPS
jgi:hypothetical protein